jgi:hypothetical protein
VRHTPDGTQKKIGGQYQKWIEEHPVKTIGWKPTCNCDKHPIPAIIFDPFSGAGTTALVSLKLNRRFIGIELNPDYVEMAEKRIKPYLEQTKLTDIIPNM